MDQSAVESVQSAPGFDESLWEDLLVFIEEKCVIPVVGADLIQVEVEGQQVSFFHWAARELSSKLGLRPDPLPADYSLNDVVCAHLAAGGAPRGGVSASAGGRAQGGVRATAAARGAGVDHRF